MYTIKIAVGKDTIRMTTTKSKFIEAAAHADAIAVSLNGKVVGVSIPTARKSKESENAKA